MVGGHYNIKNYIVKGHSIRKVEDHWTWRGMEEYGGVGVLEEGELRGIVIRRMGVDKGICDV